MARKLGNFTVAGFVLGGMLLGGFGMFAFSALCGLVAIAISLRLALSQPAAVGPSPTSEVEEKGTEIIALLSNALDSKCDLAVHYQPILDAKSRKIRCAEALVRWQCEKLGAVEPDIFIPIAERHGLIHSLTLFILNQVARDMATSRVPVKINVNVSPLQVIDPIFPDEIIGIFNAHKIDLSRIEIELTEGVMVSDPALLPPALQRLKYAGFTIALDDYGSGYSSLGYLRRFDFDTLKLDRTLVLDAARSSQSRALLDATLVMARTLSMNTVAEGVETATQADVLSAMGVDMLQGYFGGMAMEMDQLNQMLTAPPLRY